MGASLGHSGKSRKAGGGWGGKLRRDMEDGRNKEQLLDFAARLGFAPGLKPHLENRCNLQWVLVSAGNGGLRVWLS